MGAALTVQSAMFDVWFDYRGTSDSVAGSLSECLNYIRGETNVAEKHLRRWFWKAAMQGVGKYVQFTLSDRDAQFIVQGSIVLRRGENLDEEFLLEYDPDQQPCDEGDE